ncbi:flagellar biosynthesis protein FlhA [Calditerricola satsumensis]|uniref:Flagellar biosynthesis protein FlhA n=3 Tax=Calditerricola satsumensis TaxID=373054 RepID=A0A8J3F9Q6_9BACI|nr:flagellar biosynthesis protein FlhA [Calditerricola satsumensis]
MIRLQDLGVLAAVILIVLMMVIPLPPGVLDFLIFLNISLSLLILLVAMNTREPLEFAIFPSLLLLTTLFRLGLNVSTTRAILTDANAGKVVHTFGSFVIGGQPVVGFIVFLILVVIQFVVITKGAERVAEVAARFTLDAMPGKQMAIDADLNAGLITEAEARQRREKIDREADFYGAMDGASKFVKGDAIAGIVIFLINILGGFIIGMAIHGMPFTEALHTYTLLSVGDGLVSQIPALLISTATGIIVTRAASDGNLGQDVLRQILAYPKLLYVVAATIFALGLLTPIGLLTALPIAGLLALGGWRIRRAAEGPETEETTVERQAEREAERLRSAESVQQLLYVDPIEFEFGYGLIPLADTAQGGDLLDRVVMIRRQLALELGIIVPVVRIRDNIQLKPNEYVIKIRGNVVARGELMPDHYLAMSPGVDDPRVVGIETTEPAFGLPALWIDEAMKETAEQAGYTVVDPPSVVATHLTEVLKRHAHELLGRQETKALLDAVKEHAPAVVEELVPNVLSVGEIQRVLVKLLRERVSIRNLVTILETLADYGRYTKDPDILTEHVRQALSRQITRQHVQPGEPLVVATLDPETEKRIAESVQQTEYGSYVALDPEATQRFYRSVNEAVNQLLQSGRQPILLTAPGVRPYVRQLVERILPDVPVLSYAELEPNVEVRSVGVVKL